MYKAKLLAPDIDSRNVTKDSICVIPITCSIYVFVSFFCLVVSTNTTQPHILEFHLGKPWGETLGSLGSVNKAKGERSLCSYVCVLVYVLYI